MQERFIHSDDTLPISVQGEAARLSFFFLFFFPSCSVENRFTGRQEGRKMGIGPSRIKSFHCKSLDPWFSDLPVSSVTDSTERKFTAETACLPASRVQSLMSVDAGLIEVRWCVCLCVCWWYIDVAKRVLSQRQTCSLGLNCYQRWSSEFQSISNIHLDTTSSASKSKLAYFSHVAMFSFLFFSV